MLHIAVVEYERRIKLTNTSKQINNKQRCYCRMLFNSKLEVKKRNLHKNRFPTNFLNLLDKCLSKTYNKLDVPIQFTAVNDLVSKSKKTNCGLHASVTQKVSKREVLQRFLLAAVKLNKFCCKFCDITIELLDLLICLFCGSRKSIACFTDFNIVDCVQR